MPIKQCTYSIKGLVIGTYADLLDYIEDKLFDNTKNVNDIVYSKSTKRDYQIDKLDSIKIEGIKEAQNYTTYMNDESFEGQLSISLFFNSEHFNINGNLLLTPYNLEDYRTKKTALLKELGIENAEEVVNNILLHLELIKTDSLWIHSIASSSKFMKEDENEFEASLTNIPATLTDKLVLSRFHDDLREKYFKEASRFKESKLYRGLILKSKLKGIDKDLYGKIDWLFVGEDGTLHMYVIAASSENPRYWIDVKKNNFKYKMAFLKLMLNNNGVDVKNIELNLVPVLLVYNQNFTLIKQIKIYSTPPISTRRSNSGYAMEKYDREARHFIEGHYQPYHVSSKALDRALQVNSFIFPDLNIDSEGINLSAKAWIERAPNIDPTGEEPLVIKEVHDSDHAYEVIINGKTHNIKSGKPKHINKEILDLVAKHVAELESNISYSALRIKEEVLTSYDKGRLTFGESRFVGMASLLDSLFGKYVTDYLEDENGRRTYKWEILKNLLDNNILVFRKNDGTLDFIVLTAFDINSRANLSRGSNILGCYRPNISGIDLEANYGNIETVRAMEIINEMIPELGDGTKLGTITVLSTTNNAPYTTRHIGDFNRRYFRDIINEVNAENEGLNIQNNFTLVEVTDPVLDLLEKYMTIMEGKSRSLLLSYSLYGFDQLEEAKTKVELITALQDIGRLILKSNYDFSDPEAVIRAKANGSPYKKNMACLYELVSNAYNNLAGISPTRETTFSKVDSKFFTAQTVSDHNLRTIANLTQTTIDTISSEFLNYFEKNSFRQMFDKFYEEAGYTLTLNMIIGNLASAFSNLFLREDGKNTMVFKNPYDPNTDLKPHEVKLLKRVLFLIAKISHNGNFNYSSPDDPNLADYVAKHLEYLFVPLERASKATQRSSKEAIVAKFRNFGKKIRNASNYYDEFVNEITSEEREALGGNTDRFYDMTLSNPFYYSYPVSGVPLNKTIERRQRMLGNYGPEFFETNVENILIDFLAKHLSTTHYNKLLVSSKMFLLSMKLTGDMNGNLEIVNLEEKWITDYLKVNAFNRSAMSKSELKIVGIISPIRSVASHMVLAGNVVSCLRDCIAGALQNFMRAFLKLNTDITASDISKAYAYVHTHSTSNAMAANLLSKLCLRYRLSNMDIGRISERAKSNRNGALNMENWMYGTLRSPDFLNRMTLFVARCMHDGCWDAFSLDKDGNLKYDWTKDKRFEAYHNGVKGSKEYEKAKSLYLSKVREYNLENPSSTITPEEGLPTPYSNLDISVIRGLADNIYGAYDQSKRSMAENELGLWLFGLFSTWMNGIVNTYFMSALSNNVTMTLLKQEIDDKGNLLYFDENGNITTEKTPYIVWKNVPLPVLGIFPMLGSALKLALVDGYKYAWNYMWSDPRNRARLLKLLSDALVGLLLWLLFKFIITPEYKGFKKTMPKNPVLINLITELLYKSGSRAHDDFYGPLNVLLFLGENMNPPAYSTPVLLITDVGSTLFGSKNWKYLLFNNTGFTRAFKDTGLAYLKSQGL